MSKMILERLDEMDYNVLEAFRTLKTNIQFCGDNIKTIMITSSVPNEGKSTITINLARSMAESGQRVLVVDCDIRKSVLMGRLVAHLETNGLSYGLSHYLSGQKKLEEVIYTTNVENMDIIFAGRVVPNPTEILGNHYFEKLIAAAREKYDIILMDAPPLGAVIDAAVVAPHADGALLVIQKGEVSRRLIKNVKKQLDNSGVKILGAVLNKVDIEKQGYGYYKGYYKEYYGNR